MIPLTELPDADGRRERLLLRRVAMSTDRVACLTHVKLEPEEAVFGVRIEDIDWKDRRTCKEAQKTDNDNDDKHDAPKARASKSHCTASSARIREDIGENRIRQGRTVYSSSPLTSQKPVKSEFISLLSDDEDEPELELPRIIPGNGVTAFATEKSSDQQMLVDETSYKRGLKHSPLRSDHVKFRSGGPYESRNRPVLSENSLSLN